MMQRRIALAAILTMMGWPGSGLSAQAMATDIPATPFLRPSGSYGVGTYDWLWVDEGRPERYSKDPNDKRKLPIQVWYPADPAPGSEPAPYIVAPAEFGPSSPLKAVEHVKANAVTGAPVAKGEKKYPVLIYNHGAGWTRFSATFLTELLASHGYIVVSIDHPGTNRTLRFSDGTAFTMDTLTFPPQDPKDMKASAARSMEYLNTVAFPIWVEDSRFVLDRLEAMNRAPGPFQGRLDLGRVGMLGWSFGGAAAIEMARIDKRVKAAINHDGRLFGGAMHEPVGRPFMLVHHGIDDAASAPEANRATMKEMLAEIQGYYNAALERATDDWYSLTIAKTNHGHFSDLPLFMSQFKDTTLMTGRRGHEIIAAYTLAFFDRYLEGRKSALLDGPSPEYPEVTFRKK
jgi:predicted dienelactone hydrolase